MPDPLNMASSGKKGKKSKGKTLSLNNFLQDGPQPGPIRKPTSNWADDVEDTYDSYEGRNNKQTNVVLPTAPKAARGVDDISDKIPQNPPYIAYLSNLPYDIEEDDIVNFFYDMKISNMRIPKEAGETRVKGFGYVEFEDKESLIAALATPSLVLKGRRIRIEVASNSDNDKRRGGRMDMNRDRMDRPEVSTGDWRSGGRKEPEQPERRGGYREGGFNRDRGEGGGGFSRDRQEGGGFSRDRPEGGGSFGRDRDQGSDRSAGMWRDGERPSFNRDRDSDRPRFTRDNNDRYERPGGREEKSITRDGGGSFGMRRDERNGGGSYARGRDEERSSEPRTRPKLNLAPRTIPVEQQAAANAETEASEVAAPKAAPVPAASIFGNAKPVDTTARERQIEERLAKQNTDLERDGKRDDDRKRDDVRGRRYSPRRSPEIRRGSPDQRRGSPDRRRASPPRRRDSPDRRSPSPRNTDDRRGLPPSKNDKPLNKDKNEKDKRPREYSERDMPKIKTPEPITIVAKNQYEFLDRDSD